MDGAASAHEGAGHTHRRQRDDRDDDHRQELSAQVMTLRRQLDHITSLHERAEGRLQQLLNYPNEIAEYKDRLYDPEIAVPLLQAYDAEIGQLKDKVAVLMHDNSSLKADNDQLRNAVQRAADGRDSAVDRQVADEREHVRNEQDSIKVRRAEDAKHQLEAELGEAHRELADLRQRASQGFLASSRQRDEDARRDRALSEQEERIRKLEAENAALETRAAKLQKANESAKQQDEDETAALEAQRIQLQLLQHENEDKAAEVDRLRGKLAQALHQAGDNHNMHLRIIEEKHGEALRAAREEARAHEVTSAKLRAQLNRMELVPSYSGANAASTPSQAVEAQARHALELELKRVYGELASAQLQRDDAVARLEHLSSTKRTETDDKVRELTRAVDTGRLRIRELEDRVDGLTSDVERTREQLAEARGEASKAVSDRNRVEREKVEALKAAEEARRAKQIAVAAQEAATAAADEQVDREKRATRSLERRLEDVRQESLLQKDRFASEIEHLKRDVAEQRAASREHHQRSENLTSALAERERAHDAMAGKCDRLVQGLNGHKQQLAQCDERLVALSQRETHLVQELRQTALALDQQRMENARLQRERERMAAEGQALSQQLHKYSKLARRAAAA